MDQDIILSFKKNRVQVEQAITHLNRFHIRAVRKGTKVNEFSLDNLFAKMILPLWVSILEIDFNILAYDKAELSQKFLKNVDVGNSSEIEKWLKLNDFLFKERYLKGNQKRILSQSSLTDTSYHRYMAIKKTTEEDIKPFIELRNRIAHGQWSIAFNNLGMTKNQQLTQKAWTLSKKDLMLFKVVVTNFPQILKNLTLSINAFEKEYDRLIGKINLAKKDVDLRFKSIQKKK